VVTARCLFFVGQHVILCIVSGEDLSRYSSKIDSLGLSKCPYYHCLIVKVMWQ